MNVHPCMQTKTAYITQLASESYGWRGVPRPFMENRATKRFVVASVSAEAMRKNGRMQGVRCETIELHPANFFFHPFVRATPL